MNKNFENINDEMIVSYLLGELNAEQIIVMDAWINEHPANAKKVEDIRFILQKIDTQKENISIDVNNEWNIFSTRIKQSAITKSIPFYKKNRVAAAVFIGLLVIIGAYYFYTQNTKTTIVSSQLQVVYSQMSDGSKITLNKNSAISYNKNYNRNNRTISLKGEAFFMVKHNVSIPFIVKVNGLIIEDVGTSFNIKSDDQQTEIIVESGIVKVQEGNNTMMLSANEQTNIFKNKLQISKSNNSDKLYQYYRNKTFNCNGTPLEELIEALNNTYDKHIVLENDTLKNLRITVTLKDESFEKILNIICSTLQLEYKAQQNDIILYKK